jgi:beta-lactam-binding protein with PASTA domain
MYMVLRGRTVEVPNVVGKSQHDAETALSEYGLRMQVRRINDENVPVNAVSVQSPAAGATVKTGQLVRVSVSQGASSLSR